MPRVLLTGPRPVRDARTSGAPASSCGEPVELPHIEDPGAVAPADARELSRALLSRLSRLEEGSADYSYVRATLIELNVSLVRYAARRFVSHYALRPLLAALPERDRTIISLRFGEELTQAQIGERLGVSQMHVSRLLTRALAVLRTGLLHDDH
ncbi:hypothetical protein KCMC57_up57740 [Kitasatospora sp. CMC57]|uniref:RNA polymerase sigma-70 region 4 domain-containing protein n=1 Tax=Kitasatospora sp. CMC57 TaxID=3231513 RepID=A0AB33K2E3_9ACTN